MDGVIATFNWEACKSCLHKLDSVNEHNATCAIPKADWEFRLEYDMDTMICGEYEREL